MEQKSIIKSKEDSDKAGPQALVGGMLRHLSSEIKSNQEEETTSSISPESCSHINWTIANTSGPDADGIDEVFSRDYVCKSCHKLLANGTSCISGTGHNIFDNPWARRNGIQEIEY